MLQDRRGFSFFSGFHSGGWNLVCSNTQQSKGFRMSHSGLHPSGQHPTVPVRKIGVLLLNLGTPDGTDYWSMRKYLGEFLSDKRVIEAPSWFWQPLLQGVILTLRPSRSGHAYRQIWNREKDESPLRTITRNQAEKLSTMMAEEHPGVVVDWGWRYGNPAASERIERLFEQGCDRILLMALYPQYSATTTATAYDQCFRGLMKMRRQPAVALCTILPRSSGLH